MNYNPTPKNQFLQDEAGKKLHREFMEDESLRSNIATALLEYDRKQATLIAQDLGGAAACHFRVQGAHEFVEVLMNLSETITIPPATDQSNLPGNIRSMPRKG